MSPGGCFAVGGSANGCSQVVGRRSELGCKLMVSARLLVIAPDRRSVARLVVGGWWMEAGGWRLVVGGWWLEAG